MNIDFDQPFSETCNADVYIPSSPAIGGVLLLHGGGWFKGDKSDQRLLAERLRCEGFLVCAANYRLAPAHPFPQSRDDALAALQWLKDSSYEFDRDRLVIWGNAVGGNLAVEVALTSGYPAVSWSGILDIKGFMEQSSAIAHEDYDHDFTHANLAVSDQHGRNDAYVRWAILQLIGNDMSRLAEITPIGRVTSRSGGILMVNSLDEIIPADGALHMQNSLMKSGVPSTVHLLAGSAHGLGYMHEVLAISTDYAKRAWPLARIVRKFADADASSLPLIL
ncbi:alpha/beta hydrolase [Rhizobium tubonense]|nr:alpha/beta hydrolase [Rhizobium tubonense]